MEANGERANGELSAAEAEVRNLEDRLQLELAKVTELIQSHQVRLKNDNTNHQNEMAISAQDHQNELEKQQTIQLELHQLELKTQQFIAEEHLRSSTSDRKLLEQAQTALTQQELLLAAQSADHQVQQQQLQAQLTAIELRLSTARENEAAGTSMREAFGSQCAQELTKSQEWRADAQVKNNALTIELEELQCWKEQQADVQAGVAAQELIKSQEWRAAAQVKNNALTIELE